MDVLRVLIDDDIEEQDELFIDSADNRLHGGFTGNDFTGRFRVGIDPGTSVVQFLSKNCSIYMKFHKTFIKQ